MCAYVCVRKVHDMSAQERLMHVLLHTVLLWHVLQCVSACVCECLCVCASIECMYRVHNGTQWPPIT